MRRLWLLWTFFAACLAIAFGAMAWISFTVLRLDRTEAEARRQAVVEENVRLALWRMDSALTPLIAQETARPYFAYRSFTPAERAYNRLFNEFGYGEVVVPSPLLSVESPLIRVHFQFGPDGSLSSPQAPTGNMRDVGCGKGYTTRDRISTAETALEALRLKVGHEALIAALPKDTTPLPELAQFWADNNRTALMNGGFAGNNANPPQNEANGEALAQAQQQQVVPNAPAQQAARSWQERQARGAANTQARNYEYASNRVQQALVEPRPQRIREGVMKPLWINGALVLARRMEIEGQAYVQGCWLEWPAIRSGLLDSINRDLLPAAELVPVEKELPEEKQTRLLAALPVKLVPGAVEFAGGTQGVSPIRIALVVAWACVALGSVAVGALLLGAVRLSDRRGAFVSAVTHELRTPLTTVSMYAEMLEGGMVADESRRQQYLSTLRAEADRLGHLVENVLAYSRIERGSARANPSGRIQSVKLGELLGRVEGRLRQRAEQAGMSVELSVPDAARDTLVRADPGAVEQILFNLVDNATKYARSASDRRIEVAASVGGRRAAVRVRDHGPGISDREGRRLFLPFTKSAKDAANSAPGVGLGLALSRRLAREMRGDLTLEPASAADSGARFVLRLPLA